MRIAILTEVFLPKVDGIVNTLCHLLEYLNVHGHECLVIAPQGAPSSYAGAMVLSAPAMPTPFYPEIKLANPWCDFSAELDDFQPDVVHIVNPVALGLAGMRYARSRGLPLAASYHTDIPGFARRWGLGILGEPLYAYLRWIHNQADLNLCPSRATQHELAQNGFERLKVWSRGVDTNRFHPARASATMRRRLGVKNPGDRLLLYVGRLSAEKRIEWVKPVLEAAPETRLAVVGDGPQRVELEKVFAGLPVTFTGYMRGMELAESYASADIFVFPSANETFGNVALEAMASGLPVVAPAAGGLLDFIESEVNGLLFDPEQVDSFTEQTIRLVRQPDLAEKLASAGRKSTETRAWAMILDELMTQYAALTSRERTLPIKTLYKHQKRLKALTSR
jgi:glycosyltransferase involved in cell wall biosynthesis